MNKTTYDSTPEPIEKRFKRWMYQAKIFEGVAVLSDGTRYTVNALTGVWRRLTPKSIPQRERRRLMAQMRHALKMTRSEYDRKIQNVARPL